MILASVKSACHGPRNIRLLAIDSPPVHHYTTLDYIGGSLILLALVSAFVVYRAGFKVKAKCLVIGRTTRTPCKNGGSVILGCRHHRWQKPVAWIRHLGADNRLDPWLYRLHIVPPSFAPMPVPVVQRAPTAAEEASPLTPDPKMTREVRIAIWSLFVGIIQAVTGIMALFLSS